jgi:hypothetical protein
MCHDGEEGGSETSRGEGETKAVQAGCACEG